MVQSFFVQLFIYLKIEVARVHKVDIYEGVR